MESLSLRNGEMIEIKPIESISLTLNNVARNRGLFFSPDMSFACGEKNESLNALTKLSSMALARCASCGTRYFWKTHIVGAPMWHWVAVRAENTLIGVKSGFAEQPDKPPEENYPNNSPS